MVWEIATLQASLKASIVAHPLYWALGTGLVFLFAVLYANLVVGKKSSDFGHAGMFWILKWIILPIIVVLVLIYLQAGGVI